MTAIEPERRTADLVYGHIRSEIIAGALSFGERIDQEALANRLEVSRTPIREALLRLESEGFIQNKPYRGAIVREIDPAFVDEVYALRIVTEGLSARMGATNITDEEVRDAYRLIEQIAATHGTADLAHVIRLNHELHFLLYRATRSTELLRVIEPIFCHADRLWLFYEVEQGVQAVNDQHLTIVRAFEARDPDAAETAVRAHMVEVFGRMMAPYLKMTDLKFLPIVLRSEEMTCLETSLA